MIDNGIDFVIGRVVDIKVEVVAGVIVLVVVVVGMLRTEFETASGSESSLLFEVPAIGMKR